MQEIIDTKLTKIDSRFIKSRVSDIMKNWKGGEEHEYLAMEWIIDTYLSKYPYGKYEEVKEEKQCRK